MLDGPLPPIRYMIAQFVRVRTEMEVVNAVAGVVSGIILLLPGDTLAMSLAFRGLLAVIPHETIWGLILLIWGTGTVGAWLCPWHNCRVAGLFGGLLVWGFMMHNALWVAETLTIIIGPCVALFVGSVVAFLRLTSAPRHGHS